jgi:hypothetical protein
MRTLIVILIVGLIACESSIAPGVINDVNIRVLFTDSEGKGILSQTNPSFEMEDLRFYYYDVNLNYVLHHDARLDYPHFVGPNEGDILNLIPVFGAIDGTYKEDGKSTSYLDFGNGDIDTIEVSGIIGSPITRIHNVWYNGVQMQSENNCGELDGCGFKIVKE